MENLQKPRYFVQQGKSFGLGPASRLVSHSFYLSSLITHLFSNPAPHPHFPHRRFYFFLSLKCSFTHRSRYHPHCSPGKGVFDFTCYSAWLSFIWRLYIFGPAALFYTPFHFRQQSNKSIRLAERSVGTRESWLWKHWAQDVLYLISESVSWYKVTWSCSSIRALHTLMHLLGVRDRLMTEFLSFLRNKRVCLFTLCQWGFMHRWSEWIHMRMCQRMGWTYVSISDPDLWGYWGYCFKMKSFFNSFSFFRYFSSLTVSWKH